MPGSTVNWDVAAIAQTKGELWANVAIPGAGARISLHTDGTPESVANPNARHLGMTREGAQFLVKPSYEKHYADEFLNPIKRSPGEIECAISAELLQVTDTQLLALLSPGVGTRSVGTGYEQLNLGQTVITFSSVALIFPTEADPTKFAVFHLYKTINENGFEIGIGQKKLSGTSVMFSGHDIPSRASIDTFGNFWKQVP